MSGGSVPVDFWKKGFYAIYTLVLAGLKRFDEMTDDYGEALREARESR